MTWIWVNCHQIVILGILTVHSVKIYCKIHSKSWMKCFLLESMHSTSWRALDQFISLCKKHINPNLLELFMFTLLGYFNLKYLKCIQFIFCVSFFILHYSYDVFNRINEIESQVACSSVLVFFYCTEIIVPYVRHCSHNYVILMCHF